MSFTIKTKEELRNIDLNPYNIGGFVVALNGNIYTVEEALADFDNLIEEHTVLNYAIHWEGGALISENGTTINPVY
jgi:hypothetical protein